MPARRGTSRPRGETTLLSSAEPRTLGTPDAPLSFNLGEDGRAENIGVRRLRLDGEDAFDLMGWCGTCPIAFRRLNGSNHTLSAEALEDSLNDGVRDIESVVATVAQLVPRGEYQPLVL